MIYLDHAATTPIASDVSETMIQAMTDYYANPSSTHQLGKKVRHAIEQARLEIAQLLNVAPTEVYFTSGATEANNWAIYHQAHASKQKGNGQHIVATSIEHPSVLEPLKQLEAEGFSVTYLDPIDEEYSVEQFIEATTPQTTGWVMMAVNNEVGAQLPVNDLSRVASEYVSWYHVDAVQGVSLLLDDQLTPGWTSLSLSAHKFNGPKGIGLLIYRNHQLPLSPYLKGGGQEHGQRSGTENVPNILGMAKALQLLSTQMTNYEQLIGSFFEALEVEKVTFSLNGDTKHYLPNILNIWFHDLPSDRLMIELDLNNIQVSAGSACSAGTIEASHVLQAYYPTNTARWQESLRFSLGSTTTKEQLEQVAHVIGQFQQRLQKLNN